MIECSDSVYILNFFFKKIAAINPRLHHNNKKLPDAHGYKKRGGVDTTG